jgi:hypothetical protein
MHARRLLLFLAGLLGLLLVTGAAPAQQQQQQPAPRTYSQADLWSRGGDRITFRLARISLPQRLGAVAFDETAELGTPGRGLDNTIQFRSGDRAILASVYIYYPPIAHPGLTAFMTDRALEIISNGSLRRISAGTVPAGGLANGAIRMTYGGYQGHLASSAAFIKVGRWMAKLRVSGPEERRAEVESTMDALLSSLRFDGEPRPRAATLLDISGCQAPPVRSAPAVNDPMAGFGTAILLPFDPLGEPGARGRDGRPLNILPRLGDGWCLSTVARYGEQQTPILRATGPAPPPDGDGNSHARSVALAMISDSGTILEVLHDGEHYTLVYHRMGECFVLGSYSAVPSDEQLTDMLTGTDREAGRIRARVGLNPEGGSEISISELPGAEGQRR